MDRSFCFLRKVFLYIIMHDDDDGVLAYLHSQMYSNVKEAKDSDAAILLLFNV